MPARHYASIPYSATGVPTPAARPFFPVKPVAENISKTALKSRRSLP